MKDTSSKQQTIQKCKHSHQQKGLPPQPYTSEEGCGGGRGGGVVNSAQISHNEKLTQTIDPNLGGQKPKERKNSTMKPGERRSQTH